MGAKTIKVTITIPKIVNSAIEEFVKQWNLHCQEDDKTNKSQFITNACVTLLNYLSHEEKEDNSKDVKEA